MLFLLIIFLFLFLMCNNSFVIGEFLTLQLLNVTLYKQSNQLTVCLFLENEPKNKNSIPICINMRGFGQYS